MMALDMVSSVVSEMKVEKDKPLSDVVKDDVDRRFWPDLPKFVLDRADLVQFSSSLVHVI